MNKLLYLLECCAADFPEKPLSRALSAATGKSKVSPEPYDTPTETKHLSFTDAIAAINGLAPATLMNNLALITNDKLKELKASLPTWLTKNSHSALSLLNALLLYATGTSILNQLNSAEAWIRLLEQSYSDQEAYISLANEIIQRKPLEYSPPIFVIELVAQVAKYKRAVARRCLPSYTTSSNMRQLIAITKKVMHLEPHAAIPPNELNALKKITWKTGSTDTPSHRAQLAISNRLSWQGCLYQLERLSREVDGGSSNTVAMYLLPVLRQRQLFFPKNTLLSEHLITVLCSTIKALAYKLADNPRDATILLPRIALWAASAPTAAHPELMHALFDNAWPWRHLGGDLRNLCILKMLFLCRHSPKSTASVIKAADAYVSKPMHTAVTTYLKSKHDFHLDHDANLKDLERLIRQFVCYRLLVGINATHFSALRLGALELSREGISFFNASPILMEMIKQHKPQKNVALWLTASSSYIKNMHCEDNKYQERLHSHGIVSIEGLCWPDHSINISFFQYNASLYFTFSNRGEASASSPGITIYQVNNSDYLSHTRHFNALVKMLRKEDKRIMDVLNHPEGFLVKKLGLIKIYHHRKSFQKIDNCTTSAIHHGLLLHLMFHALEQQAIIPGRSMADKLDLAFKTCTELYKSWRRFSRDQATLKMIDWVSRHEKKINFPRRMVSTIDTYTKKISAEAREHITSHLSLFYAWSEDSAYDSDTSFKTRSTIHELLEDGDSDEEPAFVTVP